MTKYLTGMIALNIFPGWDWHVECLEQLDFEETDNLHGVDFYETITCKGGKVLSNVWIANPYRAIADYARSSCAKGNYSAARYLSNDYEYDKNMLYSYLSDMDLSNPEIRETIFKLVGKENYQKMVRSGNNGMEGCG